MKNPQRNQRIRIIRACRGYEMGKVYTIVRVDPSDQTLCGVDSGGEEGPWVKWSHCVSAGPDVSWDWLKTQLPGEVLELLSAFSGLEELRLKPEIRDHILLQLPNLRDRILHAQIAMDSQFGDESEADDEPPIDPLDEALEPIEHGTPSPRRNHARA